MSDSSVTNNFSTSFSSSGNLRLSGLASGINIQQAVDSIIAAKRVTAVQIETKIKTNTERMDALGEMRTKTKALQDVLGKMRGAVGLDAEDVFKKKLAFNTSAATSGAPPGHTVSNAGNILGTTVSSKAAAGTHRVEVRQIARANQVRSDAFTSQSSTLVSQGYTAGSFTVNGKTVTIDADDTLLDLRDKINNLNTGTSPSNVSATIVSASPTEHYLVMTSTKTGTSNLINFGGGTATSNSLGLTAAGVAKNQIQSAQNAILRVNNIGVDIVRESNTINDIIEGVTLDIYKAEQNTEVKIDITADVQSIKQSVIDFTTAYNDLKDFIADQRTQKVRTESTNGKTVDKTFGVLAFDSSLRSISDRLNQLAALTVPGQADGAESLSQIGIKMNGSYRLEIDNNSLDDKILTQLDDIRKLFGFNFSSSDSRVTLTSVTNATAGQVDGSGNPIPYYLNIQGTDASGNVIGANLQTTAGVGIGGANDGTVTSSGPLIRALSGSPANGLQVFFNGGAGLSPVNQIQVTVTRGVADQMFFALDEFTKSQGIFDNQVNTLTTQNTQFEDRVARIDESLTRQRESLTARFVAMETAIGRANSLKQALTQQSNALNGNNS